MRLLTFFLLLFSLTSNAQTISGTGNYVVKYRGASSDSVDIFHLKSGQEMHTNSQLVTGRAPVEIDTVEILGIFDSLKAELPELPEENMVHRNELYIYDTSVVRIIQGHDRSTVNHFNPRNVPALYIFRELGCPVWVQPNGAHDAYNTGDCVKFGNKQYESTIDANVWSPIVLPSGWNCLTCE